jgi:hypothetical protein
MQECRDKQYKIEQGIAVGDEPDKTQVNLQQRIMSILNNDKLPDQGRVGQPPIPGASDQSKIDSGVYDNAAMLRDKIANMLNNTTAPQGSAPQPVAAPNLKAAFSNPTIQKALDSLLNKMN